MDILENVSKDIEYNYQLFSKDIEKNCSDISNNITNVTNEINTLLLNNQLIQNCRMTGDNILKPLLQAFEQKTQNDIFDEQSEQIASRSYNPFNE